MKTMKYLFSLLALMLISSTLFAQNEQQREWIRNHSNVKKLKSLSREYQKQFHAEKEKAFEYALAHGLPVVKKLEDGNNAYLERMTPDGALLYRSVFNIDAAITTGTTSLYPGGSLGLQLTGDGMLLGVWDGGLVLTNHDLLAGKVTQMDNATELSDHATHVSGTLVGKDLSSGNYGFYATQSRGMAYEADLHAYSFQIGDPLSTVASEAADGLLVSNHSYGLRGNQVPNYYFGLYDYVSANTDNVLYNAPYHTLVAAAGNDRQSNPNPGAGGFNLLTSEYSTAKNDIVVAAVKKVSNYVSPASVIMSNFSSWGPTNDRRIKPDISADGVDVLSSVATGVDEYAYFDGTSMASPNTTGSLILLQELSAELNNGDFIRSATIKAIIIETALEAGDNPGPDSRFGWGLLNMEGAAQLMVDDNLGNGSFYNELTLNNSGTYTKTLTANGNEDIKVTIAWTDPAASPQGQNDSSSRLINDLDMRITDNNGNTYYPWNLHPFINGHAASNDADNAADNVEQIVVDPVAGEEYTITVTHKGSLQSGSQAFSIAAIGSIPLGVKENKLTGFKIYPNPATDQFNLSLKKTSNKVAVAVFDINGRKVLNKNFDGSSNFDQAINISNLTSGVYFVKINADGKKASKKLIVK